MKTIELKLYSILELKDDAFRKAVDDHRGINVDGEWWSETVIEDWTEKLAEMGFDNAKIYFSGFWSQGDGACFNADIDIAKFITHFKLDKYKPLIDYVEEFNEDLVAIIHKNNYANHYSHSKTRSVEVDFYVETSKQDKYLHLETLANELEKELESTREEMSDAIYKDLEKEWEYNTTEDSVVDTLQANEYTFLEDGTMFNK